MDEATEGDTHEDEDVVVGRQVRLEPDDGAEVEVRRGLVEQEQVGLDEERAGEGDAHTPTSRHVLGRLGHHLLGEAETVQDRAGLGLEHGRVHLLDLLVDGLERELVDVVGDREILGKLLEALNLGLGRGDDVVEGVDVGRLNGAADEVDVDVIGDLDVALGDRLQEGRLWEGAERGGQASAKEALAGSPGERRRTDLSAAVLSEETVTLAVAARGGEQMQGSVADVGQQALERRARLT